MCDGEEGEMRMIEDGRDWLFGGWMGIKISTLTLRKQGRGVEE